MDGSERGAERMETRSGDRPQSRPQGATPGAAAPVVEAYRAARIAAPRRVELVRREMRDPGPGEVRLRLSGCGVCGSNLPVWEGRPWFEYPRKPGSPGHEGWGVVDAVGEEVRSVRPGDRVAALGTRAFAEYDFLPCEEVVALPPALAGRPFPGEALGCAVNVFRRARVRVGEWVAVVGVGFLGALLVGLARRAGAHVIAVSRRASSLEAAERLGAEHLLLFRDDPSRLVERVHALTGGGLCDRVIEATGRQDALDMASALTAVRGTLVVAGFHQDGPRQVDMQLWNWRGLDVVNAHERDPVAYVEGIRGATALFAPGGLDPSFLYSHVLPLERLGEAFELLSGRPEGFTKALVTMR